ncbi:hypothetical protein [Pontibacter liquoris]|uniref:hypothetical protein n=1 Tax=Pontibacter liquoris TaxID=2905677 RepID=UPI001FA7FFBD|nr:hypothetical protein [Pontibacter liquoris]
MRKNLLLLLTVLTLLSCSDSNNKLLDNLQTAVTDGEVGSKGYKEVQLADLTDFEWDTLYYFQAGEDKRVISDAIGFRWEGEPVPQLSRRLLFVHQGKVASFVDYNYREFPLVVYGCNQDRWVYPKSRTRFATFKYCARGDTATYTLIPVNCVENLREQIGQKCPDEAVAAK